MSVITGMNVSPDQVPARFPSRQVQGAGPGPAEQSPLLAGSKLRHTERAEGAAGLEDPPAFRWKGSSRQGGPGRLWGLAP